MGGHELLKNPQGSQNGITSIHEPYLYVEEGLLQFLPGRSMDNDGKKDLIIFAQRFPEVKIEELIFTEKDGSQ